MKKAIVFGANGYLGRHIAYFLNERQIDFIPTDIADTSKDGYSNYQKIDVTNINDLQRLDYNVDFVFVFAGATGTSNSPEIIEKFNKINEQGLANIINCIEGVEGLRVIFPSTRLVYKGVESKFLKEDAEKEAKTIYAKNKLVCEQLLENSRIKYTIFRICVPYGNLLDNNYSYGTIGFFLGRALKGESITIYGDGSLKRTFTHVSDIVNIILDGIQLDSTINDVYNIGSNDNLSLQEVANLVALKYEVQLDFVDWPKEALEIESGDTIFNDEKLKNEINYNYKHSLSQWISEL